MLSLKEELTPFRCSCYVLVVYSGDSDENGYILVHTPRYLYSRLVPCEVGQYNPEYPHDAMRDELNGILGEWGIPYRCWGFGGEYGPNTWFCKLVSKD